MAKRQLNDIEKQQVIAAQRETDGSLRCYISGDVINPQRDDYEFDHIEPYSQGGETTLANIRVVLKSYNRRKSDQSLEDVRDNLRLERLFTEKRNSIKLQDILDLRGITASFHSRNDVRPLYRDNRRKRGERLCAIR